MRDPLVISGVRLTYDQADLATLEAARPEDWRERIDALLETEGVSEAAVVQTCNRIEEYVVTESADRGREVLDSFANGVEGAPSVEMDHSESLRHLLRVAAGLESQVLGEDQILGQVREAYTTAKKRGGIGDVLDPAFLKAIHVGERARDETAINEGTVSLGGAAIELVERGRGFSDRTVALVGAGDMARTVARSLPDAVAEVRLLNRSPDNAEPVGTVIEAPVTVEDLTELADHLSAADVAFTATASRTPVIDRSTLDEVGETLIVDLAQPGDVADAADPPAGVTVQDLDDLRTVTDATHEDRREAARAVEEIVDGEYDLLIEQYKRQRADAVISGMYRGAERIKDVELQRALGQLDDLDDDDRETVESLADTLVSQILAVPTERLREAAGEDDWETVTTAIELFDPTGGADTDSLFEELASGNDSGTERSDPRPAEGPDR